jgi:hypothetical protein
MKMAGIDLRESFDGSCGGHEHEDATPMNQLAPNPFVWVLGQDFRGSQFDLEGARHSV